MMLYCFIFPAFCFFSYSSLFLSQGALISITLPLILCYFCLLLSFFAVCIHAILFKVFNNIWWVMHRQRQNHKPHSGSSQDGDIVTDVVFLRPPHCTPKRLAIPNSVTSPLLLRVPSRLLLPIRLLRDP